ncbi:uncharacterized protein MONOS_8130 [Monocercomonoides exilis]|uniref:uncharacterized protein n=1 Tax=Monocercomonoides exilis TaxID=2049356 RepID=UPI003559985B|nr:hypothetical protein MONOS_8130 [Monocercomonoides exilis]|eukprot:MONOS_8130.1-p1 / transcript=MONOS_8130.1 / gene=MONOS_8130 / organism=Monocercomonoides_exilis_PA203 / gene_product=unspecified product / transcript_product=unspecified product / location=Mono_scaffold00298:2305-2988(+) / protein_length=228 / sequence_SO=supercontig / SO=protein_coding / is_pseudo=false
MEVERSNEGADESSTSFRDTEQQRRPLSRLERAGDYTKKEETFKKVISLIKVRPTLDAFAAHHNHKLERWCSIGSPMHEDGLSVPWSQECVFAHPPIPLIPMVIRKAQQERAQVVLLLPNWKGQNWEVLLRHSNFYSWELNFNIQELMERTSMKKIGAYLPPGKLRLILLNPSKENVNCFGNKLCRNERFQRSLVSNAEKALHNPHGMDTFSDLHVLLNNGNYAGTQ